MAALLLRPRAPVALSVGLLALSGAGVAWGGILLAGGSGLELAVLAPLLALLVPFHVRVVLGPFRRR
ncbi:MAG TPA: hypothetical protein VM638_08655 [Actinomycetota bacterium]|nr:hypothetical protein [Actinomycetota bacterium]